MGKRLAKVFTAAAFLLSAGALFSYFGRKQDLPGKGQPAIVHFSDGTTLHTTWDQVFARAQERTAWFDPNPGGGWMYKTENGAVGHVLPPSTPAPTRRKSAASQPH